jgi:hypothetical protein
MEPVTEMKEAQRSGRRPATDFRFPYNNLHDSLDVANAIHEKGGGSAKKDQLAAFLGYSTTKSGTFHARIAAARLFGLVTVENASFVMTPLARKILMPVYKYDRAEGLVEAFLAVPLFKALYDDHYGKDLPPGLGLQNLFRTKFKITGRITDVAIRAFLESADQAGFFATRGTRTHLIKPTIHKNEDGSAGDQGGGGGGDETPPPPIVPVSDEYIRQQYILKLISMLDSDKVEDKNELMQRIENLLAQK